MNDLALLNPAPDADGCQAMLDVARKQLQRRDNELTTAVLDRENYLQKIGAANALRALITEMEREYARRFEV